MDGTMLKYQSLIFPLLFTSIIQSFNSANFKSVSAQDEPSTAKIAEILLNSLVKAQKERNVDMFDDKKEPVEFANEWVVEIVGGEDVARETAKSADYEFVRKLRNLDGFYIFRKPKLSRRKREAKLLTDSLTKNPHVKWAEQQKVKKRYKRDYKDSKITFNDPLWPLQWQLYDSKHGQETDLSVAGAWKMGYTGRGVIVSILDDGIQHNHTDLVQNYDVKGSYDLNDNDPDPMPTFDDYNRHGTRCAGEVAMAANNSVCGVGIAYDAGIAGVRMLDGRITDHIESEALNYGIDHVHIYSSSWGPNDDGKTVDGPGRLAQEALVRGIKKGRQGKGSIFVWASGNGGHWDDDCDCDGYTDSIYTFSVSSASQDGSFPWYGEMCASTLTTTYSAGSHVPIWIATTDIGNECTTTHAGTSASAPLAAGIIALGLQANPALTWRDVQHIAVWTAEPAPLLNNDGWNRNNIGLYVNTRFGFGLMNATAFVMAAKSWKTVPEQRICTTIFPTFRRSSLSDAGGTTVVFRTDACEGEENEINYLEHVQLVLDITYSVRGHLAIYLTSPNGTRTQLLAVRREDKSKAGFNSWPFMSVHSWGEEGKGRWQLEVIDRSGIRSGNNGSVNNITLILYGTKEPPAHYVKRRIYNMLNDTKKRIKRSLQDEEIIARTKNLLDKGIGSLKDDEIGALIKHLDRVIQKQPSVPKYYYELKDYRTF